MDDDGLHLIEVTALLRETTARLVGTDDRETSLPAVAETIGRAVSARCGITLLRSGRSASIAAYPRRRGSLTSPRA